MSFVACRFYEENDAPAAVPSHWLTEKGNHNGERTYDCQWPPATSHIRFSDLSIIPDETFTPYPVKIIKIYSECLV